MPETNQPQRQIIPVIIVVLLSLFTVIPLASNVGLPNGSDVLYHVYRVAEMDRSWAHGVFFPRWAEGLYFGYGSPLFHYYSSLTYYITSILIRLFDLTALDALRTLIMICFVGGGTGMYFFASQRTGRLGGIIAALVYIYSPYIIYTEPYARGTYAELLAFALAPIVFWRFERLIRRPQGINIVFAAISIFLLILSHNLMSATFALILGLWIVWQGGVSLLAVGIKKIRSKAGLIAVRPYIVALGALFLAVGLAAYFWLPVVLERDAIQLENVIGVALLDYRNFFVTLPELLSPTPLSDAGAINGLRNVLNLGLAQWTLGLAGFITVFALIALAIRARKHNDPIVRQGVFFGLMSLILLIVPTTNAIWETFGFLALLQFPWRLLGPLVFCLAILASMNALWINRLFDTENPLQRRVGMGITALIVVYVIGTAFPTFFVPEWTNIEVDTSIAGYHEVEVAGLQMGTTFTDEYRPHDVSSPPGHTESLLEDYADGYPVDRANHDVLPASAQLELINNTPQSNEWHINTEEAFTMEVYTFYWKGWVAEIDGQRVEITPSPNHGLITFPVPVGEHTIRVYLGTTAARIVGNMLSVIALILIFAAWRIVGKRWTLSEPPTIREAWSDRLAFLRDRRQLIGVVAGGILVLILLPLLFREGISWLDSIPGEESPAQNKVSIQLDEQFSVIGYDINEREFRPGETLRVVIYWYPLEAYDVNFSSFLHVSTGGPPVAQADKLHPGGRAISEWWTPDGYIYDEYSVWLPDTLAPGEYNIYTGLYTCELMPPEDCGNGYRPTVVNENGEVLGDTVPLGTITIR